MHQDRSTKTFMNVKKEGEVVPCDSQPPVSWIGGTCEHGGGDVKTGNASTDVCLRHKTKCGTETDGPSNITVKVENQSETFDDNALSHAPGCEKFVKYDTVSVNGIPIDMTNENPVPVHLETSLNYCCDTSPNSVRCEDSARSHNSVVPREDIVTTANTVDNSFVFRTVKTENLTSFPDQDKVKTECSISSVFPKDSLKIEHSNVDVKIENPTDALAGQQIKQTSSQVLGTDQSVGTCLMNSGFPLQSELQLQHTTSSGPNTVDEPNLLLKEEPCVEKDIGADMEDAVPCSKCNQAPSTEALMDCHSDRVHRENLGRRKEMSAITRPSVDATNGDSLDIIDCDTTTGDEEMSNLVDKGDLQSHMQTHGGDKPTSTVCDKAFRESSSLLMHMRFHNGEKPYKCNVCDKAFYDDYYFRKHKQTHVGDKPFTCTACDKSFRKDYQLQLHMRIHTGERPYKCIVCNKAFRNQSNHRSHMQIHNGEKPFKCTVCCKAFRRRSTQRHHMRTHNGEYRVKLL